jgi:hypothetical protein
MFTTAGETLSDKSAKLSGGVFESASIENTHKNIIPKYKLIFKILFLFFLIIFLCLF